MSTQASTSAAKSRLLQKNDDDVVIVSAVRSAITKDTKPELLLSHVLRAAYSKVSLDPKLIEDISVGNVLPPGGGATAARMAALHAGIPIETSINTVNRQCSSGLTAITQIANEIKAGQIDIGIVDDQRLRSRRHGRILERGPLNPDAEDCLLPMGITSENVAADYGITRAVQDEFAAISFQRAAKAQKEGKFKEEIVPITAKWVDPKTEQEREIVVDHDDGKDGTTHAGNASQVSDSAAAVLLARRSVAKRLGLPILGKFVTSSVVGVPPRVMGIGPAFAIPRVLQVAGITPTTSTSTRSTRRSRRRLSYGGTLHSAFDLHECHPGLHHFAIDAIATIAPGNPIPMPTPSAILSLIDNPRASFPPYRRCSEPHSPEEVRSFVLGCSTRLVVGV
ncbi:3-ketoacyl-CoA thiolase [Coprinopsis cinerea AmutBmut pab1-1]|nr:3-ketoacyl-CoA thiolase [Coprinopsis cinerea AmutBmut pab1-1]